MGGFSILEYKKQVICDAWQYKKQVKISFKAKNQVSINQALQLLHTNLFGPMRFSSLGGKKYAFVIVDEPFKAFSKFYKRVQNEKRLLDLKIRSDHGGEFKNVLFEIFCDENSFKHGSSTLWSALRAPQQNGVVIST